MNIFKYWRFVPRFVLVGGLMSTTDATTMQDAIEQLSADAAKQYVAPIVSGFGANLNSGWYHKAPPAKMFSFTIEGGVMAMGTFLGTGAKTFNDSANFRIDSAQASALIGNRLDTNNANPIFAAQAKAARQALIDTIRSKSFLVGIRGPTITGSRKDTVQIVFGAQNFTVHTSLGDTTVHIPDTSIAIKGVTGLLSQFISFPLPLMAPQVTVGTVLGTNLSLRWLPTYDFGTIGKVSFFGFGIQHNPAVWMPGVTLPIDICAGYFHQNLSVGSLFDAAANAYSLDVSKTLGVRVLNITPYGGFQYETSTMSFHYNFKEYDRLTGITENIPVKFDLEGENSTRWTAGLSLHFLLLNLNADYSFAKYNTISAGLMFGI